MSYKFLYLNYLDQISPRRLWTWSLKSGTAVLDQGLTSISTFAVNILLARWLAPEAYGAFAIAFAVYLFLAGFHNALILEPMTVLGPANYPQRLGEYFRVQLKLHGLLTAGLAALLIAGGLAIGLFLKGSALAPVLLAAAAALPFLLFLLLVRRYAYVIQRPALALLTSAVNLVLVLGGLLLLRRLAMTNAVSGFGLLAGAGLSGGALTYFWFATQTMAYFSPNLSLLRVLKEHWGYGKWLVAFAILYQLQSQTQIYLTGAFLGLGGAGVLRAMQTFMMPMIQVVNAIAILSLPILSQEFGQGNHAALRHKAFGFTALLVTLAILYEAFLLGFHGSLEQIFYGGKFSSYAWLIPILGLIPVFGALGIGFSLILRAAQKPQLYLYAGLITAPIGLLSALIFIWHWGLGGAAASMVLTYASAAGAAFYLYRTLIPQPA
jgi:O-antigen/teichoic acid export membrane protein